MENIKYYTPDIEEFHIGFEYEFFNGKDWEISEILPKDFSSASSGGEVVENWFEEIYSKIRNVRVKCLDREDVKSLGFTDDGYEFTIYCKNYPDRYSETKRGVNIKAVFSENGNFSIYYPPENLFEGTVKNKSELKKILKMLSIE